MRTFVTGGSGFIGGALVRALGERGDEVVALARSPEAAGRLRALGCQTVAAALTDVVALKEAMAGSEAVFHVAGLYEVGIPDARRPAMYATNVDGTAAVIDAAVAAGAGRIVHVSTVNVFGNTEGRIVDERDLRERHEFLTYYDETKYLAHQVATRRAARGAPVVVAMPGGVYGPGDSSQLGAQLEQARHGTLTMVSLSGLGMTMTHVDDIANGILLAAERGHVGEPYILAAEVTTLGEAVRRVAELAGQRPPRFDLPDWAARAIAPLAPLLGQLLRRLGYPPNLEEAMNAGIGVTYWASSAKARRELGWSPRDLDAGLCDMLAAAD